MDKYAFVGDLHSRVGLLNLILSKDPHLNYHYVFVGDILHHKHFFHRRRRGESVEILDRVYGLYKGGRGTLVLGNNENYILQNLLLPSKSVKKMEVRRTLKGLKQLPLNQRLQLLSFLSSSPLSLEIGNYRIAHAYYLPSTQITTESDRSLVLHGPGHPWFRSEEINSLDPNYKYFIGHYGMPYSRKNLQVLDATNFDACGVYYTDREEFVLYYL